MKKQVAEKGKGSKRHLESDENAGGEKRARVSHEEAREYGLIESVSLRNFMCHDNLKFDFDPHMNFIIGQNGSGKSAILTGIILALGGKSSATGRYSNVKGFIKNGKNSATVTVTLKNTGIQAYKPEEYGEKIIVERVFNSDGISSYKLKDESGHVISTAKEELTNILTTMDIQIDNPVAVLTQETSRSFLSVQNSRKLFELFYKGTGLQRAEEEYNKACNEKREAETELQLKKKALPDLEKEVKKLKIYVESSVRLLDYQKELIWAGVIEFEKLANNTRSACESAEKEAWSTKAELMKRKETLLKMDEDLDVYKKDKETCEAAITNHRVDLQKFNEKYSELSTLSREVQGSYNRLLRESKSIECEISSLENTIKENRLRSQSNFEEEKRRHEKLKERSQELEKLISDAEKEKDANLKKVEEFEVMIEALQRDIQSNEYHIEGIKRDIHQMTEGIKNHINVFGSEMKYVLQEIEEAAARGEFKKKPKGPIGNYVGIKHPEWNLAIEQCLGSGFLRNFCCDNHQDSEKVMTILSRHCSSTKMPGLIVSEYLPSVHNIDAYKVKSPYSTVFDMLSLEDPVIANCLIDQKRIESIILIPDAQKAFRVMIDNPPKNCVSAYTLNGDLIIPSPYRCYSCKSKNRVNVLKSVNEEDIRNKKKEWASAVTERDNKKKSQAFYREECQKQNKNIVEIEKHIYDLKCQFYDLNEKIKDLIVSLPQKDMDDLEEELAKCKADREEKEVKVEEQQAALASTTCELASIRHCIGKKKNDLSVETGKHNDLNDKICICERMKANISSEIKALEAKIKTAESNLASCEKNYDKTLQELKSLTKKAEKVCPRIETDKSCERLKQIIKETKEAIEKQSNYTTEDLRTRYTEVCEKLVLATEDFRKQETILQRITQMLNLRMKKFSEIKKNTQLCVIMSFMAYLKENHFCGQLDIDLEKETLVINARPKKISSTNAVQQSTSQLSGGERSYITISFLLALWERMLIPFRILDEYDVFMDSDFRHLCVNLLVHFAECRKNVQCMLLSPLDLPEILHSDYVKVHKMNAPKRQLED